MHTTTQEYKGFTIEIVSYDGIGTVTFRFFVKGEGFKTEGYPTLNHAKGAITNFLKAQEKEAVDSKLDAAIRLVDIANHLDHVIAHKTMPVELVKASRNKREGHYFGKICGSEHRGKTRKGSGWICSAGSLYNTRKQRKARKLEIKAHGIFIAQLRVSACINNF